VLRPAPFTPLIPWLTLSMSIVSNLLCAPRLEPLVERFRTIHG
jgi:hypothetical protein